MNGSEILPRQGEVAPKATEGEAAANYRESVAVFPSTMLRMVPSPWRGRIS